MRFDGEIITGNGTVIKFDESNPFTDEKFNSLKNQIHSLRNFLYDFIILDFQQDEYGLYFLQFIKGVNEKTLDRFWVEVKIPNTSPSAIGKKGYYREIMFGHYFSENELIDILFVIFYKKQLPDFSSWKDITTECLYDDSEVKKNPLFPYAPSEKQKKLDKLHADARKVSSDYWQERLDCYGADFLFYSANRVLSFEYSYEPPCLCDDYIEYDKYEKIIELYKQHKCSPYLQRHVADIAFYGYLGKPDYKKAYKLYLLSAKRGNVISAYMLAMMYKKGLFVKENYATYEKIIMDLYNFVNTEFGHVFLYKIPQVVLEASYIEQKKGNLKNSLELVLEAEKIMLFNIDHVRDYSQIELIRKIKEQKYSLTEFDKMDIDIFDLFYVLKSHTYILLRGKNITYPLKTHYKDGILIVEFQKEKYMGLHHFFYSAILKGKRFIKCNDEIVYIEVNTDGLRKR